ncbi:protein ALTERED PHOSPHATE STARVATION RESPONSE 1-like [Aristolochia californica]|uniref:protein ALTERED PHOSPHATE STARVATION RESPONSE 1-like n=1 Tax=Aristolochia californica TaxID=171875 RepID=UPI0035E05457
MGCSTSKLDDEEAVQLCKDRKRFIKQAIEYRTNFAAGHIAYIQSLKRVSAALRNYVEGDEPREFFSDSYSNPLFTPIKNRGPDIVAIPLKSFTPTPLPSTTGSSRTVNYLRPGGNPPISVEEMPPSPETIRIQTFSPAHHFGIDGFFAMDPPHMQSSFFSSPLNSRPSFPPPSPPTSQWDFFWNPFSSLDTYGYPNRSSLDRITVDHDEINGLRQVREEEGIPDLEEEDEEEQISNDREKSDERSKIDSGCDSETSSSHDKVEIEVETDTEHEAKGLQSHTVESVAVSEARNNVELELSNEERAVEETGTREETPGFTVYVNRRPTSMAEVVKDLETQFMIVCDAANEISNLLEASRALYSSTSNDLTAAKLLNPVALFRSASSRSTSSRFFHASSSSRDDCYDTSSDISDESCMFSGSHQSTLDRLYAWEKKLYEEVKSGERIRIAYEKKCMQLRNQDVKGEDPSVVDKTRAAVRDLQTQIKVSIHSIESISKRIETLRDEELYPQLIELMQGLTRMWRVMTKCHQSQKNRVDEAKLLLASTPKKCTPDKLSGFSSPSPHGLARSASNLESELRNWRSCFQSWIASQRSYVRALTGWALRCTRSTDTERLPFSPRRSGPAPPIFSMCILWSRFLDRMSEIPVVDGLDFFAAGIGSMCNQMREEEARRKRLSSGGVGEMELVEIEDKVAEEEKTAEVAVKVLCAGMAVAVASLTEFAGCSAEGYEELVKQWEKDTWQKVKVGV